MARYNKITKGLHCYLDTRFIFRLLGLEGVDRQIYYQEFIQTLLDEGATLHVFTHTYDEIMSIISESEKWVGSSFYDPTRASLCTQYFISENFDKSEVALFKLRVKSKIEDLVITIDDAPLYEDQSYLCISEEDLYKMIVVNYKKNSNFDEEDKKLTILRDVKSILSILINRKGKVPATLEDTDFIFITLNNALAYISKNFYVDANSNNFCIPPCISDTFLGALVWASSPSKVSVIYERKIIADCYAALQPSVALLKKFMHELNKIRADNKVTADEYYMLKTHKLAMSLLEDKTFGDPENVTDKTPEEIYHELIVKIKQEEITKLRLEEANQRWYKGAPPLCRGSA